MPRKRRRRAQPPSGFELLDRLVATGVRSMVDAAARRLEAPEIELDDEDDDEEGLPYRCQCLVAPSPTAQPRACNQPAGRVCFMCQKPFCRDHTEFHNDEGWAICLRCIDFMVQSSKRMLRRIRIERQARARHERPRPAPAPARPPPQVQQAWEVLGVPPTADAKMLKSAYRRIALETHPDRHPDRPDLLERYKEATEAYRLLMDALERDKASEPARAD